MVTVSGVESFFWYFAGILVYRAAISSSVGGRMPIEDEAFLGPHCVFTNDLRPRSGRYRHPGALLDTRIGRGATVGANATIVCGHTVGTYAMVAAGAVVTRDVAPHALVAGVPARRVGFVCACGERLPVSLVCSCGLSYEPDGPGLRAKS